MGLLFEANVGQYWPQFNRLALQGGVQLVRAGWNEAFLKEVNDFPRQATGIHDDIIDSAGLICKRISAISAGEAPVVNKAPEPVIGGITVTNWQMHTTSSLDELWEDNRSRRSGILRI